jgi:hypothetical protein
MSINKLETFWNGRREAEADAVQKYIPFMGSCNTPALENYRVFMNLYYRFYNDGDQPNNMRLKSLAKKAGIADFKYVGGPWAVRHDLERIGDGLLDAALAEIESGIAQQQRGAA